MRNQIELFQEMQALEIPGATCPSGDLQSFACQLDKLFERVNESRHASNHRRRQILPLAQTIMSPVLKPRLLSQSSHSIDKLTGNQSDSALARRDFRLPPSVPWYKLLAL
jgi:hypothetical protein